MKSMKLTINYHKQNNIYRIKQREQRNYQIIIKIMKIYLNKNNKQMKYNNKNKKTHKLRKR